jgi:hypothetical protein
VPVVCHRLDAKGACLLFALHLHPQCQTATGPPAGLCGWKPSQPAGLGLLLWQATVQAALGQLPSDAVARAYPVGSPNYERYTQYGTDALTTAVFEIIISGTLGSLMVRWLSPLLLKAVRPTCGCSHTAHLGCAGAVHLEQSLGSRPLREASMPHVCTMPASVLFFLLSRAVDLQETEDAAIKRAKSAVLTRSALL